MNPSDLSPYLAHSDRIIIDPCSVRAMRSSSSRRSLRVCIRQFIVHEKANAHVQSAAVPSADTEN